MYIDKLELRDKLDKLVGELNSRNLYFAIVRSEKIMKYFIGVKIYSDDISTPTLIVTSLGDSILLINSHIYQSLRKYIDDLESVFDIELWGSHSEYLSKLKYYAGKMSLYSKDGLVDDYMKLTHFIEIQETISPRKIYRLSPVLNKLKRRKRMSEVFKLTKSANIASSILEKILDMLSPGVSEIFIYKQLKGIAAVEGYNFGFDPVVRFGEHTVKEIHIPTDRKLNATDIASISIGIEYRGYFTPVTYLYMELDSKQALGELYNLYRECSIDASKEIRAGQKVSFIASFFDQCIRSSKTSNIYSIESEKGYGIGIELKEEPLIINNTNELFTSGETLSIAPIIYIKHGNKLLGFRASQAVVVTDNNTSSIQAIPNI